MELVVPMPVLHFRPVEARRKPARGLYAAPLYLCPARGGTRERPSLVGSVELKAGGQEADHWVLRGTALLLALAN
jgi:dynein heavy chain